jgi:hypothetical protein
MSLLSSGGPPPDLPLPDAYAFSVDRPLEALRQHLNALGPWEWIERDSFWYGDYISTRPLPHDGIIKIYEQGDRFVIQLKYRALRGVNANAVADCRALHRTILTQFLPAIGAREVEPDEGFD